jgi:o-succinylbenzoate---CoA ligase
MHQFDSIFAKSTTLDVTYGDLYIFSRHLFETLRFRTGLSSPLVVLQAESTIETIKIIASCWLTKIPFVIIPENATYSEISTYLDGPSPDIIIGNARFILDVQKLFSYIPSIDSTSLIVNDIIDKNAFSDISKMENFFNDVESKDQIDQDSNSIFAYLFTSGTTSLPKCVPLTRSQIIAATESTRSSLPIYKTDQWLLSMPLNHIGGISIITRSLILGSSLRYISKFDAEIVKNILSNDSAVTFCSLVPTQLQKIIADSMFKVHSKFKCILLGGGPIPESLIETARSRNIPVISSFGMTETTAQCIAVPFSEMNSAPLNSCGKPLKNVEIQIREMDNEDSISQNFGFLWIRGPQIIKKYFHTDQNHVFDQEGWFNTEDYAEIDSEGFVRILMRRTDRIVTGGENVNPVEIENLLLQMPNLTEVAVVGIPDIFWGQKIVAIVPLHTTHQQVKIDDIKSFLSDKVAQFKIPKELIRTASIPRTQSGKIKRSTLIDMIQNKI